jgi:methylisocitrate lyase
VPLLANMTEFGKSQLLDAATLQRLGFNMVIYPVTTLRLAMKAIENGLRQIAATGTQQGVVADMQTRQELYDLLRYEAYAKYDADLFNFKL